MAMVDGPVLPKGKAGVCIQLALLAAEGLISIAPGGSAAWTPSTSHLPQTGQGLCWCLSPEGAGRDTPGGLVYTMHPLPGFALLGTADRSGALWGSLCCMDRNGSSAAFVREQCEFISPKSQRPALTSALLHWL